MVRCPEHKLTLSSDGHHARHVHSVSKQPVLGHLAAHHLVQQRYSSSAGDHLNPGDDWAGVDAGPQLGWPGIDQDTPQ